MFFIFTINFIGNILLTIVLFISSRNIKLLKIYQKLYLSLSIILWIIICLIYLIKLISFVYIQITKKYFHLYKFDVKLKWIWIITNGCSYLFMLIGLIYDIVLLIKGEIANVVYPIIYFVICFIYFICSLIDFFFIEILVNVVCRRTVIIGEDKPVKKDNDQDSEENKTKLE